MKVKDPGGRTRKKNAKMELIRDFNYIIVWPWMAVTKMPLEFGGVIQHYMLELLWKP